MFNMGAPFRGFPNTLGGGSGDCRSNQP
jgi:hypothetical protein